MPLKTAYDKQNELKIGTISACKNIGTNLLVSWPMSCNRIFKISFPR